MSSGFEVIRRCRCILVAVLSVAVSTSVALPSVRYVRIENVVSDPWLRITEVMVFPCSGFTNIARGKVATGSPSTLVGGSSSCGSPEIRVPSLAVDGVTSCSSGSTLQTFCSPVSSPWWQVDLGAEYDVCSVSVLLFPSGTGTGGKYLTFRNSAGVELTVVTLNGMQATSTSCGATSCVVTTVACGSCSAALCSNQASAFVGNYPACECSCNSPYTGATCNQQPCSNATNCNNRASTVNEAFPACTCTCLPEWTGTTCALSNICTNIADCNNRAISVSGNRPVCSCTCQPEWTGTSCQTSNVCTNVTDCNGRALVVSGNRPTCTCSCMPEWIGSTCAMSNVCTNAADCYNHAANVSGNRPDCSCGCVAMWTGPTCNVSNMCTNDTDCNGRASAVSGNRPTCACTCAQEWTGVACETSNACTTAADCNSHALTVDGFRPSCNCSCLSEWTATDCGESNVCTTLHDCSNNARSVAGNRPMCTCDCFVGFSGLSCEYSHTQSYTASLSLSFSVSDVSPTTSATVVPSTSTSPSASLTMASASPAPTETASKTVSLLPSGTQASSTSVTVTAATSATETVPTQTLPTTATKDAATWSLSVTNSVEGASMTLTCSQSRSRSPSVSWWTSLVSPTSSASRSSSATRDSTITATVRTASKSPSSEASFSLSASPSVGTQFFSATRSSTPFATATPSSAFSASTSHSGTPTIRVSLTKATTSLSAPSSLSRASLSPVPSSTVSSTAEGSPTTSESLEATFSLSGSSTTARSLSITSGTQTVPTHSMDASHSASSTSPQTMTPSSSKTSDGSASAHSMSTSTSHSRPTMSKSSSVSYVHSASGSISWSKEQATTSDTHSGTQSGTVTMHTDPASATVSLSSMVSLTAPTSSSSMTQQSSSSNLTDEASMTSTQTTSSTLSHSGTAPSLSPSGSNFKTQSTSFSLSVYSTTHDGTSSLTRSSSDTISSKASTSVSPSLSWTISVAASPTRDVSPSNITETVSRSSSNPSETSAGSASSSSTRSPSPSSTREGGTATAAATRPSPTWSLSDIQTASSTRSDIARSITAGRVSRSTSLSTSNVVTENKSPSLSQAPLTVSTSPTATGSASRRGISTTVTTPTLATLSPPSTLTESTAVSPSYSGSVSRATKTRSKSRVTNTQSPLTVAALPFAFGTHAHAWLSEGIPLLVATFGMNGSAGPVLDLYPVDELGQAPTSPYRAPVEVHLRDPMHALTILMVRSIDFPQRVTGTLVPQLPCRVEGGAATNAFGAVVAVLATFPEFILADVTVRYPTLGNTSHMMSVAIASNLPTSSDATPTQFLFSTEAMGVVSLADGVPQSLPLRNGDPVHAAVVTKADNNLWAHVVPTLSVEHVLIPYVTAPLEQQQVARVTIPMYYSPLPRVVPGHGGDVYVCQQAVEVWTCPWSLGRQRAIQVVVANITAAVTVEFPQPWSRSIEQSLRLTWWCVAGDAVGATIRTHVRADRQDPCTLVCTVPQSLLPHTGYVDEVHLMSTTSHHDGDPTPLPVRSADVWRLPLALENAYVVVIGAPLSLHVREEFTPQTPLMTLPAFQLQWWLSASNVTAQSNRAIPLQALGLHVAALYVSSSRCSAAHVVCDSCRVSDTIVDFRGCVIPNAPTAECFMEASNGAELMLMVGLSDMSATFTVQRNMSLVVVPEHCPSEPANLSLPVADSLARSPTSSWHVAGCPTDAFPVTGRCALGGGDTIIITTPNNDTASMSSTVSTIQLLFVNKNTNSSQGISVPCTDVVCFMLPEGQVTVQVCSCRTPPAPNVSSDEVTLVLYAMDGGVVAILIDALSFANDATCPHGPGNTEPCSGNGLCDSHTLRCNCYGDATLGYFEGADCSRCVAGYYGSDCTARCPSGSAGCSPCSGHGTCRDGVSGSGLCMCVASTAHGYWAGDDCGSCAPGYFGSTCTSLCPAPVLDTSFPAATLVAVCNKRGTCDDGIFGSGLCNCSAAFRGSECRSCSTGYFGSICAPCPTATAANPCSGHGRCNDGDLGNGTCQCTVGYVGQSCNVSCPLAFGRTCGWGMCDPITAQCVCTAPNVVRNPAANDTCSACVSGFWGVNCTLPCPCAHGSCDVMSGNCSCSRGYWGALCTETCPGGSTTPCNLHGECDQVAGVCICHASVVQGYYAGVACEQCHPSFSSPSCTVPCPQGVDPATGIIAICSNRGMCFNGTCSGQCRAGYWGEGTCAYECPGGATNPCNGRGACDAVNGFCSCTYGAVGVACEMSCQGGYSAPCSRHGICTSSGACQCFADSVEGYWAGAACTTCASPFSGPNCTVPCDGRTGTVQNGVCTCATGYVGAQCNIPCPLGTAESSSPKVCSGHGTCSLSVSSTAAQVLAPDAAVCTCDDGFYGVACAVYCTVAYCLEQTALVHPQCNVNTGQCECQQNSVGHFAGVDCSDCTTGYWGSECSLPCPCSGRGSCNRYTSNCQCAAGIGSGFWGGPACATCAPGYIGANCNVRNVEISSIASASVSTANIWFPLSGIALHDPNTDVVLVGSSPLVAFLSSPWESNVTFLQLLHPTLPALGAGVLNATHIWIRLAENPQTGDSKNYALVDRRLLSVAAHPTTLNITTQPLLPSAATIALLSNQRQLLPMSSTVSTSNVAVWTVVSKSGRCQAEVLYLSDTPTTSRLLVSCAGDDAVTSSWSDVLPTQQIKWIGFTSDSNVDQHEQQVLVVSWTSSVKESSYLAWALRVYPFPQQSAAGSVDSNSSIIPLVDGCSPSQGGCGVISHCLLMAPGSSLSMRLLCAAETSLESSNHVVLFAVDLADGSEGAVNSIVIPAADQVAASSSDVDHNMYVFAFRGSTTAMLCRAQFDTTTNLLSLVSEYALDRIQGDRPTVLAMALNTTTRTLWLSVGTSQTVSVVAVNLFSIRAVQPYVFDQQGGAAVTIQGVGFVPDPLPMCEFQVNSTTDSNTTSTLLQRPSIVASAPAVFINSTTMLCTSKEVTVVGQCDPLQVNVWYQGRSTSTTLVASLRPLTATLVAASTTTSGGAAAGWHESETRVTLIGYGFVPSATRASCRLDNMTSGAALAWWGGADVFNSTLAYCTQPSHSPITGQAGALRYSHDNTTFSNAVAYTVVGPYSHTNAEFMQTPTRGSAAEDGQPTIMSAPRVPLPAIRFVAVDAAGSPLGVFDTTGASRQLTCQPQHPLYPATTSVLVFAPPAQTVTPTNGSAIMNSIMVMSPTTDASASTVRYVYCYDALVPLAAVRLSVTVSPGAPASLQFVTLVNRNTLGFASGVTAETTLPTISVVVVDVIGNRVAVALQASILPQVVVCTFTKVSPIPASLTPISSVAMTQTPMSVIADVDQTTGYFVFDNVRVQSPFGISVQLAFKAGNVSMLGNPLSPNSVASLLVALPQRPCDSTALLAVLNTFDCVPCPAPATCDGTDTMVIPPGYWRGSSTSLNLYACDPAHSCATALDCAVGYEGPTCGSCSEGFGRTVSSCEPCTSDAPRIIVAVVVLGVVGIVWALGLRGIAFTAVEDIASKIVDAPEETKRGALPIVVKLAVSHLQMLSMLPLSALKVPWAVSTAEGSGQWSVVTPTFLNVACAIGRRAHDEMVAVVALFGLALCGCGILAVGLGWLADKKFKKSSLKISIQRRAKEVRSSGASPMRYRVADAMITTSHFRRAVHRERVLRNHRDLLEVYIGDGEGGMDRKQDVAIFPTATTTNTDKPFRAHSPAGVVDTSDEEFTFPLRSTRPMSVASDGSAKEDHTEVLPQHRASSWFYTDVDLDELDDIGSPTVSSVSVGTKTFPLKSMQPSCASLYIECDDFNGAPIDSAVISSAPAEDQSKCSTFTPAVTMTPKHKLWPLFHEVVDTSRLAQPNLKPPPIGKRVVNVSLVSLVVLGILLYPTIVQAAQRVISCRTLIVGGGSATPTTARVLAYDPGVDCSSLAYTAWLPAAAVVLVVVGAGFPLLCPASVVAAQHATCAGSAVHARHLFHFVTGGYRVWYWEAIVLLRKAAIVVAMVVVGQERDAFQSFSLACSWIFGASFAANVVLAPWQDATLGQLELLSLAVLCSSSLLLAVQSSDVPLPESPMAIVFIAVNAAVVVALLHTIVVVATAQAAELIKTNAPTVHDVITDRSGMIEQLRRQCQSTKTLICVTHSRLAKCVELAQFVAAHAEPHEDPPLPHERNNASVFEIDFDVTALLPVDVEDEAALNNTLVGESGVAQSASRFAAADVDLWDVDIGVYDITDVITPPLELPPWWHPSAEETHNIGATPPPRQSQHLRQAPTGSRGAQQHLSSDAQSNVVAPNAHAHVHQFLSFVAMFPRSVAAYEADVAVLEQQSSKLPPNHPVLMELSSRKLQLSALFTQLIDMEHCLVTHATQIINSMRNRQNA